MTTTTTTSPLPCLTCAWTPDAPANREQAEQQHLQHDPAHEYAPYLEDEQQAALEVFTIGYARTILDVCAYRDSGEEVHAADWQTPARSWPLQAFDPDSQREIQRDAEDFFVAQHGDLAAYVAAGSNDWGGAGVDFALTRAGHGAGFWDKGLGDVGDRLTTASKGYGSGVDAWIDSDDVAHVL